LRALVDHAVHLHRDPGFTAFKVKCTGTSPVWDVAVLHALRAALGDDVKLRWGGTRMRRIHQRRRRCCVSSSRN